MDEGLNQVIQQEAAPSPEQPLEESRPKDKGEDRKRSTQREQPKHSFAKLIQLGVSELRRLAKEAQVTGYSAMKKEELVLAIMGAQASSQGQRLGGGRWSASRRATGSSGGRGFSPGTRTYTSPPPR